MGLIDLIKVLSNTEKTRILGDKTSAILRYTFTNNEQQSIPGNILDDAILLQYGAKIIKNKNWLISILESLNRKTIKKFGFTSYDEAIKVYTSNKNKLIEDFLIEDEYLIEDDGDTREDFEYTIPKFGECSGTLAYPHNYQLRVKKRINCLLNQTTANKILAVMPTGAGKTLLAMEILVDIFRSSTDSNTSIGWFVDSPELCEQSFLSFQKAWKQKGDRRVRAQRFYSKYDGLTSSKCDKATFATFKLLVSRLNTDSVIDLLKSMRILVLDEAHISNAETYSEVIDKYLSFNPEGLVLGLTATPYRTDDQAYQNIKGMFNEIVTITDDDGNELNSPIEYLVKNKYLAKTYFQVLNTEFSSDKSHYYSLLHEKIRQECISLISRSENSIIFAKSKSHAIALSIFLKNEGINNELIVGDTLISKRKRILDRFEDKNSDLSIIVNHQILAKGIDVPGMNSIMILPKIESPPLALQILGRAMRGPKNGGNDENTIYLTKDNYNKLKEYKLLESTVLN